MKNKFRKYLALLLTVLMLASCMPVDALAAIVPVSGGTQTSSGISLRSIVRPPVATATYIFMNGDMEFDRQILKHNETLKNPGTPAADSDKKEFVGWLADDGSAPAFGKVTVTATTETTYRAQFADVYFVFFINGKGEVMVTKKGKAGDTISTEGVTYPVGNEESIVGWEDASGNLVSSVTLNGSDVTLKARVENGHWITYDSQGGSYVAPAFVKGNGTTTAPAVPTRPGYTFDHWSETVGGTKFTFGNALTTALTLYAVWTKNDNTQYTVIHWQENADDDEYSYAESEVKTGTTGAQTSAAAKSTAAGTKYNGFTAQTIAQQTIAGDGSTIVNVYYKRNVYDVKFFEEESGQFPWSPSTWEENISLRITAKHGANIRAKWPTGTFWYVSQNNQNTAQSNLDTMPIGGKNFYGKASGNGKANYYVEVLPGEEYTITVSGKNYKLDHTDTGYTRGTVTDEERYEMTGFTCNVADSAKNGNQYNGAKFYYTRNKYNVVYINNGTTVKTSSYLYQASIADAGGYTLTATNAPAGKEGYIFDGWYDAPEGGNKFIFTGKTMPAQNVTVYAHWAEPTVNGKAHIKVDGTDEGTTLTATYGEALNAEELKTLQKAIMKDKTGYTWRGWRTGPNGTGEPFNVDTKIYSDITLYPYYTKDGTFSVTYVVAGENSSVTGVEAPTDFKKYADDSFADLMAPTKLVSDDGQYFLGWSDGKNIYQPRDKYKIKDNVTFTGVWGARPATVSLTYKANDGTETKQTIDSIANNATVTTIKNPFTRAGYSFVGWDTSANGPGSIKAGTDVVQVDNDGDNILYAIWTANTNTKYTVEFYYQNTDGTYPDTPNHSEKREGTTDTTVSVTADDKADKENGKYVYEADNKNKVESGIVAGDGSLVLKLYFKLNTASYTIHHYLNGTTVKVADDQTDTKTIGETLTANKSDALYPAYAAAVVAGYDPSQTITINATGNVITVYYTVPLTITAEGANKTYDGQPLTQPDFKMKGLVNGDTKGDFTLSMTAASTITNAGNTPNVIDTDTVKYKGGAIPSYYNVSYEPGTLTVNKASVTVTITGVNETAVYDGRQHEANGYNYSFNGKPGQITISLKPNVLAIARRTDVGTTYMGLTKDSFTVTSANYDVTIKVIDGYVTITPVTDKVTVTVTENGATVTYDGNEHSVKGYKSMTADNTLYDVTKSVKATETAAWTAKGTNAGEYPVGVAAGDFENINKNFTNVAFVIVDGVLKINPITEKTITVTANSKNKTYDGTPLTDSGFTFTPGVLVEGDVLTAVVEGSATNVGDEGKNVVKSYRVMRDGVDVTANYTFNDSVAGKLTINPKAVTVTAENKSKVYGEADPELTATVSGLLGEDKVDYTLSRKAGEDVGEYEITAAGEEVQGNYKVTYEPGKLTITPVTAKVTVTITENSATVTYDGTEHSVKGYASMTADNKLYDVKTSVTETETEAWAAKGTNAGRYEVGIVAGDFVNTNKNFTNVEFVIVDGALVINPISDKVIVTVTEKSATYTYDGAEHSVSGYKSMTADNDLYDVKTSVTETATAAWTAKGTNVGTYNVGIEAGDFVNTNKNFTNVEFVVVDGVLKITKATLKVTFTGESDTRVYNGSEQRLTGIEADGLLTGHKYEGLTYLASGTDAGEYTGKFTGTVKITDAAGVDVTENYIVEQEEGKLVINPITDKVTVTVTEKSATYTYDGAEHSVTGYKSMTADNTLYDVKTSVTETETAAWTAKGTNVGEYPVGIVAGDFVNTNTNFTNVEFVIVDGVLKINPITDKVTVTVVENSDTVTYDGTEHSVTGYESMTADNKLYDVKTSVTETPTEAWTAKGTNAGTYEVGIVAGDFKNISKNFTNVEFVIVDGTLVINPITEKVTVTVTENSDTVTYDGTEHSVTGYKSMTADNKLYDVKTSVTETPTEAWTAKGTNAGTYEVGIVAGDFKNISKNFTNVEFVIVDGTLVINPITEKVTVTVTENSDTVTYDGTEHSVTGYKSMTADNKLYDVKTSVTETPTEAWTAKGTNAGEYPVGIVAGDFKNISTNFTNVEFVVVDGKLVINPRPVTFTAQGNSVEYDGQAHGKNPTTPYTVEQTNGDRGLVDGHTESNVNIAFTAISVGTYTKKLEIAKEDIVIKAGETDVTANYAIQVEPGTLTITQNEKVVTITANSHTWEYDGQPHSDGGYTVEYDGQKYTVAAGETVTLPTGDVVEAKVEGTVTNVADSADDNNKVTTVVIKNAAGTETNDQYKTITLVPGGLKITKRGAGEVKVTLKAADNTVIYDGQPHGAKLNAAGEIEEGTSYTITNLAEGHRVKTVAINGSETNVGEYPGKLAPSGAVIVDKDGNDVTENYEVNYANGKLTITARDAVIVEIVGNKATYEYDGKEHEATGYKVERISNSLYTEADFSLAAGVTAQAKGTNVGTYKMGLTDKSFVNTNPNFANVTFVVTDGELKITKRGAGEDKVVLKAADNTVTYDGQAHGAKLNAAGEIEVGTSYTITNLAEGHSVQTVAISGSETNAGVYPGKLVPSGAVIVDKEGNEVTENYEVTYVNGTLTINKYSQKVTVTVIENSATVTYDGTEHSVYGYKSMAANNALYTIKGSVEETPTEAWTAKGTNAGEYPVGIKAGDFKNINENFADVEFVIVDGALVIDPISAKVVTVTITENSATYTYDGTEHSVSGYKSMTADNTLYDVKTSVTETETAAWTAKGTNVGEYPVGIVAGDFVNTNTNFTNVEFVIVDGALTINPITDKVTVTITENSGTATYDGKEHSVYGHKSMTADNELYDVTTSVTATPTEAWTAKGTNVGEYPVGIVAGDFKNINGNFTNVEFVIVDGALKITEANIKDYVTLNTVNVTEKYDGKPHATGTATAEDANNNELKIEYSVDGKTWTEDPSTITATDVADSKTVNVRVSSANYDGYVEGTQELTITKRKVTLTSATDSKPYDGTPLTNSNVTVGGEGFVEGEGASYDVTGTITNVGSVDNTFTYTLNENTNADNYGITKYEGKLTVTGDKIIPEKTTPNVESNYKLGDTILFTITVKNVSTEPVEKITVEDQMAIIVAGTGYTVSADGHTATIASLASGAQVEIRAEHVVTEKDILAGTVGNTATVTWPDGTKDVSAKSDDIEKPNSELKVVKETTSEPKNGETYALDEEIKYTITVTNTGNLTATDIEVTDSLSTNEGKVIGTIASLAPGEPKTFNFTYTVTEQDILNGKVLNEATAKGKTPDDKTPEGKDEQKDDTDDIDTTLEVIKTSNKQPGETAKLGEKIEYTITVTNKGNVSYTNVKVDDELTGLHETIAKLGVGESKKFTTEWTVTEDDILNGKVLNVATAKGDDVPDPKDPENPKTPEGEGEKKDDTEGKNSELKVVKETTSEPKNGKTYALGEEIKYTITVTNTGNLTATDIEVTDSLSTNEGKVIGTIASLAPDESKTFNFTYTVTEDDILNGKVLNVATAKGKTPDPDGKDPEGGGSTEDETDDIDTTLEVVKTSNKQPGETAKLGEKIEYTITVTNKGNVSYTNVKVDDELTGLHETIAKLGVGESKKFTTEWTVTEDDILNGKVLNVATAKGDKVPDPKDPENPKTPEGEGKKEDDTEEKQSSFNVEKTLTNLPEKGYFTLGETAEFNITVENTGNLTLTDLTVTEQLSGAKYAESNAYTVNGADAIIAELKPGEQVVIKASYTITEDDLGNKDLKNVVTGKGKGPDGKDPEGGDEEEVPTDDAISVSGSKTWDDQDNRFEVRPETITLRLHADGAEYKTAEIGADQNWTYKFSKLPKHTKSGAEIVYTVTEDAVMGYETTTVETDSGVNFTNTLRQCTLHIDYTYIRHKGGTPHEAFPPVDMVLYYGQEYSVKSPKLWGFVPNIHKVEGVITEDTVVHVLYSGLDYTLTIEYVYEDGTTAAPTHTEVLKIYDRYGVASPKIPGYVPTWEFVAGSMYAHDEYYRIVYRAIKPQGVGNITLNLGDCFE